eukprot:39079_1
MAEYPRENWSTKTEIDWSLDKTALSQKLLSLSKAALIKICIAKNVSCGGNKSSIVLALVKHNLKAKQRELLLTFGTVSNGNLNIKIKSFKKLKLNKLVGNQSTQIIYRMHENDEWSYKSLDGATFIPNGSFHLSVPILLNDYNIHFYIQIEDKTSTQVSVNVPSFLIRTNFSPGEKVIFKEEIDSLFTNPGVVEKIVDAYEGYYQVYNYHYDPSKGPKESPSAWDKVTKTVHHSKIWGNTRKIRKTVDLNDNRLTYKHILMNNDAPHAMDIFHSIYQGLDAQIKRLCVEIYGTLKGIAYVRGSNEFLTKNIFDMLFDDEDVRFVYKVGCFVDGNDGWLQFVNVAKWDIDMIQEILKGNDGINFLAEATQIHSMLYSCDWCSAEIKTTGYFYVCDHECFADKHYYCLKCVSTVIKLNGELKILLMDLLHQQLVDDCVQTIVDFVVGSVVKLSCR